ncbi:MBL fold metallo-hydrolase [Maribacter sp. TH_r10]|uniref:MBL fold metallo-hydrolase n=1 Tax=Maribacter sp. TH_r10 TaxID=3082086 RepID=UPI0029544696|nr:MBL fold metallo-hydrolase [Maribacter sp. TH_r10]MDV7140516.1 MBL fold metallo-hydrolase [Maribacter sp. TH_r10]
MKRFVILMTAICMIMVSCKDEKKSLENNASSPEAKATMEDMLLTPEGNPTSKTLKITPIEHATAVLDWNDITIYIDPVGGADAFKGQKEPDLILITDIHGDHLNVETLQALNTEKAKIIVPQAVADGLPEEFNPQIDVLNNGESKERYGIKIEAVPMYNLREEAKNFHEIGRGNGYILNMGDQRIYFSGDTEDIPEMRALKDIDIAFVCMNLPYTMTVESAADAVLEFKPKQVYPYHYRGKPDVSDVAKFKALVEKTDPNIEVIQLDWYPNQDY